MLARFIMEKNLDHSLYQIASPVSIQVQFVYLKMAELLLSPVRLLMKFYVSYN